MKKIFSYHTNYFPFCVIVNAQDTYIQHLPQKGTFFITNATIHVGNGQ